VRQVSPPGRRGNCADRHDLTSRQQKTGLQLSSMTAGGRAASIVDMRAVIVDAGTNPRRADRTTVIV